MLMLDIMKWIVENKINARPKVSKFTQENFLPDLSPFIVYPCHWVLHWYLGVKLINEGLAHWRNNQIFQADYFFLVSGVEGLGKVTFIPGETHFRVFFVTVIRLNVITGIGLNVITSIRLYVITYNNTVGNFRWKNKIPNEENKEGNWFIYFGKILFPM